MGKIVEELRPKPGLNGPISLREFGRRLEGPDTVSLKFLSYNTYLLQGLQIPLGKWIDNTGGWDTLSWFGLPPARGTAILVMLGLPLAGLVGIGVLEAAGFTPSRVIEKLTGLNLHQLPGIQAKPGREGRADQLGRLLGEFDFGCLCEVFTPDSMQRINAGLAQSPQGPYATQMGPDDSGEGILGNSGLYFFARKKWPIVKTAWHIFKNRGDRHRDSDAWANKGVLLNVIDLGFGHFELYQTHLYYGGGIPLLPEPSPAERIAVRRAELEELASFYNEHHQSANAALITGDFNMSASVFDEHVEMQHVMSRLNMQDLWARSFYENDLSGGFTNRYTDGTDRKLWDLDYDKVCSIREQSTPGPERNVQLRSYCDERTESAQGLPRNTRAGVGRYDYIFLEQSAAGHAYHVEASRVLRRPFPLIDPDEVDGEKFVADHLGLDVELYFSPR